MIFYFKNIYHKLQVKLLISFRTTILFDRINQLSWYKSMLHQWVDNQHFPTGSNVLEVGCATGALTAYIASLAYMVAGVDYSRKMIEVAKTNYSDINFSIANITDLPFENNSYQAIMAASVVNIVSEKNKAVSELFRVCKKGGIVTILVPLAEFNNEKLLLLQTSLGVTGFSRAAMNAWHNLAPKMNTSDITSLFKQAGLTKITTKEYLQGMVISISGIKPY